MADSSKEDRARNEVEVHLGGVKIVLKSRNKDVEELMKIADDFVLRADAELEKESKKGYAKTASERAIG